MESQPQNPEYRNNLKSFPHVSIHKYTTSCQVLLVKLIEIPFNLKILTHYIRLKERLHKFKDG